MRGGTLVGVGMVWAGLLAGCATGQLPPAIPEEPTVFRLPPPELLEGLGEIVQPPPEMLELAPRPLGYARGGRKKGVPAPEKGRAKAPALTFVRYEEGRSQAAPPLEIQEGGLLDPEPVARRPQGKKGGDGAAGAQVSTANLVVPRGKEGAALVRYAWQEDKLYLILTAPDHPVVVSLPPGEKLSSTLAVNPKKFDLGYVKQGDGDRTVQMIIIRPTEPGLEATTQIVTQHRTYYLRLKSVETAGMLGVRWSVPEMDDEEGEGSRAGTREREVAPVPGMPGVDVRRLHTGYSVETTKGSPPWVPIAIWDDGRRTVVKFKSSLSFTNAPAVFAVRANGEAGVVEWTAYEVPEQPDLPSYYVVGGIWPRLMLRGTDNAQVTLTRSAVKAPAYQPIKGN